MGGVSIEVLEGLLRQVLTPDTSAIRAAVEQLNVVLRHSECVMQLLHLIQTSPHVEVRQLAAVLLRKRIVGHWSKLKGDTQKQVQAVLLQAVLADTAPLVRSSVSSLVSVVARVTLPVGQWDELLPFLVQCASSQQVVHRQVGLALFAALTESTGDTLRPHFSALHQLLARALQDSDSSVRMASLAAIGSLVQWLTTEQEVTAFGELIPLMCQVIMHCLENDFEDEAIKAFEVFDDLMESPLSGTTALIPLIMSFVLKLGSTQSLNLNVRQKALTFIEWVLQYKPKSLIKNNLLPAILEVIFQMCSEPDAEDLEADELTAHKFAAQLVDMLALHLPSKHIFNPTMQYVTQYLTSPKAEQRKAAIVALAVLSEGCSESMRENLRQLLSFIFTAFKDSANEVRESACIALGQFSRFLQPEIIDCYQEVLPCLFQSLSDPTEKVRVGSCYALEAFCENLGAEVLPYLDQLLSKLVEMLQNSEKREVQEIAISAISSTAAAAGKAFVPYYSTLIKMMKQLMTVTSEEDLVLRCRATECAGLIALAVGREVFEPDYKDCMTMALEGCALDFMELREYTYGFFSNMAEIYQADFSPYLTIVVPILLASCDSTDGITGTSSGVTVEGLEEDEDEDDLVDVHIRTAFLDEKSSACHSIGVIAEMTGSQFLPFVESVMKHFSDLTSYFHEDVRQALVVSTKRLCLCVFNSFPSEQKWQRGVAHSLHPNVRQFLDAVVPDFINTMATDDDKTTVMAACESIAELVKVIGPSALEPHMDHAVSVLVSILKKKTTCQTLHEDEDDEEDVEMEVEVIEHACDCIIEVSKVMGQLMVSHFVPLCKEVLKYMENSSMAIYRSTAIGTLAEMSNSLGPAIADYVPNLIPLVSKGLTDTDPETRSNSTFCVGVLFQCGGERALPYYNHVLPLLADLFNDKSGIPNIIDNACGAVARMIMTSLESVPLQQVLPIFLNALPLKKDFEENTMVYSCLFHLIRSSNPVAAQHLARITSVFVQAMGSEHVEQVLQQEMALLLRSLQQQNPMHMDNLIKSLPEHEQQFLHHVLHSSGS